MAKKELQIDFYPNISLRADYQEKTLQYILSDETKVYYNHTTPFVTIPEPKNKISQFKQNIQIINVKNEEIFKKHSDIIENYIPDPLSSANRHVYYSRNKEMIPWKVITQYRQKLEKEYTSNFNSIKQNQMFPSIGTTQYEEDKERHQKEKITSMKANSLFRDIRNALFDDIKILKYNNRYKTTFNILSPSVAVYKNDNWTDRFLSLSAKKAGFNYWWKYINENWEEARSFMEDNLFARQLFLKFLFQNKKIGKISFLKKYKWIIPITPHFYAGTFTWTFYKNKKRRIIKPKVNNFMTYKVNTEEAIKLLTGKDTVFDCAGFSKSLHWTECFDNKVIPVLGDFTYQLRETLTALYTLDNNNNNNNNKPKFKFKFKPEEFFTHNFKNITRFLELSLERKKIKLQEKQNEPENRKLFRDFVPEPKYSMEIFNWIMKLIEDKKVSPPNTLWRNRFRKSYDEYMIYSI